MIQAHCTQPHDLLHSVTLTLDLTTPFLCNAFQYAHAYQVSSHATLR